MVFSAVPSREGNLFVQHSEGDEAENLLFAASEGGPCILEVSPVHVLLFFTLRALTSAFEMAFSKASLLKGFSRKSTRAAFHGLNAHRNGPVGGDENDGKRILQPCEILLEFDAAQIRHLYIQDETPRSVFVPAFQELRGRSEGLHGIPCPSKQSFHGFSHRRIIVDDIDDAIFRFHGGSPSAASKVK